jgi:hypothetical protein|tara:strand:- start:11570 stop:11791 length:222 start_codon:yes stop_codon:yes gene_type:complete
MGFAILPTYQPPKPRYKGTVVCQNRRCHAEYSPGKEGGKQWYRGYRRGSESQFHATLKIDDNECPMCGTEAKN